VPFGCAWPGGVLKAGLCSFVPWLNVFAPLTYQSIARKYEERNQIDNLDNLQDDRVFVFHTLLDPYINWFNSLRTLHFYKELGVRSWKYEGGLLATHGFVSFTPLVVEQSMTHIQDSSAEDIEDLCQTTYVDDILSFGKTNEL
jgi:hypothetical protein